MEAKNLSRRWGLLVFTPTGQFIQRFSRSTPQLIGAEVPEYRDPGLRISKARKGNNSQSASESGVQDADRGDRRQFKSPPSQPPHVLLRTSRSKGSTQNNSNPGKPQVEVIETKENRNLVYIEGSKNSPAPISKLHSIAKNPPRSMRSVHLSSGTPRIGKRWG